MTTGNEKQELSQREKNTILEEKGTLLSDDEWAEIDKRLNSPMAQVIGSFGSRVPRINKRADGKGLCKLRKPSSKIYLWNGEDSCLACTVDAIIDSAEHKRT